MLCRFPSAINSTKLSKSDVTPAKGSLMSGKLSPSRNDTPSQPQNELDLVCCHLYLIIICFMRSICPRLPTPTFFFWLDMTTESLCQIIFFFANAPDSSCERSWGGGHGIPHLWVSSKLFFDHFHFLNMLRCTCYKSLNIFPGIIFL